MYSFQETGAIGYTLSGSRRFHVDDGQLTMLIFAVDQPVIQEVIESIEDFCKGEMKDELIDKLEDQKIISILTDEQVYCI